MSNKLQFALRAGVFACCVSPSIGYAFIDERTPATPPPASNYAPALQVDTTPPSFIPSAPATSTAPTQRGVNMTPRHVGVGLSGDLSNPAWRKSHMMPSGQMPLANALISVYYPILNEAIEINAEPFLLNQNITINQNMTREALMKDIANQLQAHIRHEGSEVTVLVLNESAIGAPSSAAKRSATTEKAAAPMPSAASASTVNADIEVLEIAQATPISNTRTWSIKEGDMLSTSMLKWANEWGWRLIWKADVDYQIAANITLNEDFLGGAEKLLNAYSQASRPLWGDWNASQKVLVINEPSRSKQ